MTIVFKYTNWQQDKTGLSAVRRQVFIEEQNVPEALEWDEQDATAYHVLVTDKQQAIATGRLVKTGQIGRMAVIKNYRNQGIATKILNMLLDISTKNNIQPIWLNAQLTAIPFYEKNGFICEGEVFDDAGIPHKRMIQQAK